MRHKKKMDSGGGPLGRVRGSQDTIRQHGLIWYDNPRCRNGGSLATVLLQMDTIVAITLHVRRCALEKHRPRVLQEPPRPHPYQAPYGSSFQYFQG